MSSTIPMASPTSSRRASTTDSTTAHSAWQSQPNLLTPGRWAIGGLAALKLQIEVSACLRCFAQELFDDDARKVRTSLHSFLGESLGPACFEKSSAINVTNLLTTKAFCLVAVNVFFFRFLVTQDCTKKSCAKRLSPAKQLQ